MAGHTTEAQLKCKILHLERGSFWLSISATVFDVSFASSSVLATLCRSTVVEDALLKRPNDCFFSLYFRHASTAPTINQDCITDNSIALETSVRRKEM